MGAGKLCKISHLALAKNRNLHAGTTPFMQVARFRKSSDSSTI
jgi:hypothetical protein